MIKKCLMVMGAAALLFSGWSVCRAAADTAAKEKAAIAAAEAWLKLVDDGKYADSWKQAAAFFKNAVPQDKWETQLSAVRKPMGKKLTRTLGNSKYATTLPGAPDGEYVVIQFSASFENKKSATETVTPMLEKDGKWRVSGYYIK